MERINREKCAGFGFEQLAPFSTKSERSERAHQNQKKMDAAEAQEEQEMELEALESIYMEDYKLLTAEGAHPAKFQLRIVPVQGGEDKEEDGNYVAVRFICEYTPLYPSEVPQFQVENEFGLTDLQLEEIRGVCVGAAEENLDQVMIYSIVEAVTEWLQENNRPESDGSAFSEMKERARIAKEKKDQEERVEGERKAAEDKANSETEDGKRKRYGTPVTVAVFNAWNEIFMAEVEAKDLREKEQAIAQAKTGGRNTETEAMIMARPSGKSLFSKDITELLDAEKIIRDELAAAEDEEATETKSTSLPKETTDTVVPVDVSLFLGGDDDDLGNLSDLDDDE